MDKRRKEIIVHPRGTGRSVYQEVLDLQLQLFQQATALKLQALPTENHLLFCEHEPTYTLGKNGSMDNMLFVPENVGAAFHTIDRGGDITFHGPGQLVVYPIFDLDNFGIGTARFVEILEEAVIHTLKHFGITSDRLPGAAGIWVNQSTFPKKVCAIGIKVSRHITMHGIAININTDLAWFSKIVPCGLQDKGVTSIAELTGKVYTFNEVENVFLEELKKLL
ncbi:MAG: lipoyl(octanoyl) transferase LipB [Chitinophagales bacterium]